MKKLFATAIVILLILSTFAMLPAIGRSSQPPFVEPDYIPVKDAKNTVSGPVIIDDPIVPDPAPYYNIGDVATWIYANLYNGAYYTRNFILTAETANAEIWLSATGFGWPAGDPRATPVILPNETQFLINEFESLIYPTDTNYFGAPAVRDGNAAAFGPPGYYNGSSRVVILVMNIRDYNYYVPSYPYYVVGYFDTGVRYFTGRNVVTIDSYAWERRLGPLGSQWATYPNGTQIYVNRPYVMDSTIAHEFQHLIHADWNPADPSFMNEGCSMYAEFLCGFGLDTSYPNSYFATPDNSLTEWGDQGDINILADYGESALWVIYINDHYGGANTIRYFVQNGIPGIDGVNAALKHFGYKQTFDDVFHDWRLANLIRADFPGCKKYNYTSIDVNALDPVRQYKIGGLPVPLTKGTDFGNTITTLGYDTGVSRLSSYGTDYIRFENWTRPGFIYFNGDDTAQLGWSMTADGWWSGFGNMLNVQLISQSVTVNPTDPTLTLITKYGLETNWDFGFVQVSTDNGVTWTSLANTNTTSVYLTDVQAIVNNLPGFTGYNLEWPGWTTETFDLSAYAGQTVKITFRYMTDEATNYEGWFIKGSDVSGTALALTPYPPYPKASFQVTVVNAIVCDGHTIFVPLDMWLTSATQKGMSVGFAKNPSYVVLVVSPIMHEGTVDYAFQATKLPLFKFFSDP
jgi:immune inhibitor A